MESFREMLIESSREMGEDDSVPFRVSLISKSILFLYGIVGVMTYVIHWSL